MANFLLTQQAYNQSSNHLRKVVIIDGYDTTTEEEFYEVLATQLAYPETFNGNLDAFDEIINDLDWLDEKEIILVFRNYDDFLAEENDELREIILTILDDAAEEWKRTDDVKTLSIVIEPAELAIEDLETIGISYEDEN